MTDVDAAASGRPLSEWRIGFHGSPPGGGAAEFAIATPWLGGASTEMIFPDVEALGTLHGVQLHRAGALLLGRVQEPVRWPELAAQTEALYRRLLRVCAGRRLWRIWNYVPRINDMTAGLENYRAFCVGRSLAFETHFGAEFAAQLPAASAVGCGGEQLSLVFVASEVAPVHFENPAQVPAYEYPREHGPRPPSFARATVARANAHTWTFISGTAAIRGHETVAPDTLAEQIDCTLENLRLIAAAAGAGGDFATPGVARRHFKVYLRHATDLPAARTRLEQALLRPDDRVIYLESDICREALRIEIEATLVRAETPIR